MRTLAGCSTLSRVNEPTTKEALRLYVIACRALWREVCYLAAVSRNRLDIQFLKRGLHDEPDRLRQTLKQEIAKADEEHYDAVALVYGLCGRGVQGLRAGHTRIVVPRAHDCVTLLLGSKQRYDRYFAEHPGTYWYTASWIETAGQPSQDRYEATLRSYIEKYGEDNGRYLMETLEGWTTRYSCAAYVDWGIGDNDRYKRFTRDCADFLGWQYDELVGDPSLLRDLFEANWDEERFVMVRPGDLLCETNDERILVGRAGADDGGS